MSGTGALGLAGTLAGFGLLFERGFGRGAVWGGLPGRLLRLLPVASALFIALAQSGWIGL